MHNQFILLQKCSLLFKL